MKCKEDESMRKEAFEFAGFGGVKLPAVLWLPDGEPRRILQITHGMTEHIGRYEALAENLTAQGIAVAGYDLRGHGQNPGNPDVASFGEDGWEASLEDMHLFFALHSNSGRFSFFLRTKTYVCASEYVSS